MNFLVVVSSVAKSLSSTKTSASVKAFIKVDFPAFVYPTIAKVGIAERFLAILCVFR